MGKVCHLFLTREKAYFLHNLLSGEGIQCVAQFHKETLFDDYCISSQNEDCIAFAVDISLLQCAVRSSVSICSEIGAAGSTANRLQIKLVKKLPPNLIQDVPISKPLSRAQGLELQTALDMAQDIPPTLVQKTVAPSEDQNLSAQTRSERAISRGDDQSVQVIVKHFSKSLQCHLAKPDCAFFGIA
ncbi:hypothetical protein CUMW_259410, partial [Citrus unshiu]